VTSHLETSPAVSVVRARMGRSVRVPSVIVRVRIANARRVRPAVSAAKAAPTVRVATSPSVRSPAASAVRGQRVKKVHVLSARVRRAASAPHVRPAASAAKVARNARVATSLSVRSPAANAVRGQRVKKVHVPSALVRRAANAPRVQPAASGAKVVRNVPVAKDPLATSPSAISRVAQRISRASRRAIGPMAAASLPAGRPEVVRKARE